MNGVIKVAVAIVLIAAGGKVAKSGLENLL